jgi:hypothetical protein
LIHLGTSTALVDPAERATSGARADIAIADLVTHSLPRIARSHPVRAALGRVPDTTTARPVALIRSVGYATPSAATLHAIRRTCLAAAQPLPILDAGSALTETLLDLAGVLPVANVRSSVLEAIGDVAVAIWHAVAVRGIVDPTVAIPDIVDPVEMVIVNPVAIDVDVTAAPSAVPSPSVPASVTPNCAQCEAGAE